MWPWGRWPWMSLDGVPGDEETVEGRDPGVERISVDIPEGRQWGQDWPLPILGECRSKSGKGCLLHSAE